MGKGAGAIGLGVAIAVAAGVAVGITGAGEIVPLGEGEAGNGDVLRGVLVAEGVGAIGLGVAITVAPGVGVATGDAVARARGVGDGVAITGAADAVAVGGGLVAPTLAAGEAEGVVVTTVGFWNLFGGAFGGGVASDFNLKRARSASG